MCENNINPNKNYCNIAGTIFEYDAISEDFFIGQEIYPRNAWRYIGYGFRVDENNSDRANRHYQYFWKKLYGAVDANCALINGKIVIYHLADISFERGAINCTEKNGWDYLGQGKMYSHSGVLTDNGEVYHFWYKFDGRPEYIKNQYQFPIVKNRE